MIFRITLLVLIAMKITAYIEAHFFINDFLTSFIIQFEIKCKITADVWAIFGYVLTHNRYFILKINYGVILKLVNQNHLNIDLKI